MGQILVVNCMGEELTSIESLVRKHRFQPNTVKMDNVKGIDVREYAGTIVSGSPILLTQIDYTRYLEMFDFIPKAICPTLGICFGHQIIGLLFGAKVFKGPEQRIIQTIQVVEKDTLFQRLDSSLSLMEDHCEGITLPHEFQLLAKSKYYEVESMKHREKEIYGVQFHPETSGEPGPKNNGQLSRIM